MDKCEVCNETAARYRCPRCAVRTCCLKCVNQHKAERECDGQRDKTAFIKLDEFTDIHLLNDYRFLEDCGRKNSNAGRDDLRRERRKPYFVTELQKQARLRNIDLDLLPFPMSRRKHNSTHYQTKTKKLFWHIEWIFPQAEVILTDKRIHEDTSLKEALERHLGADADPIVKHKLKLYVLEDRGNIAVFMKKERCEGGRPSFYKLDLEKTISDNLQHKHLIEYPVLQVVLRQNWQHYPVVSDNSNREIKIEDESSTSKEEVNHSEEVSSDCLSTDAKNNISSEGVTSMT